jgi:hypothetical protein
MWVRIDKAAAKKSDVVAAAPKAAAKDKAAGEVKKKKGAAGEVTEVDPESSEAIRSLCAFVFAEFTGSPIVSHVKRSASSDMYIINTKCQWCANKGGEHGSAFVYYIATPRGVYQRCFSVNTQTSGIRCDQYRGPPKKLPEALACELFPSRAVAAERKRERSEQMARAVAQVPDSGITQQVQAPGSIVLPRLPPGAAAKAFSKPPSIPPSLFLKRLSSANVNFFS